MTYAAYQTTGLRTLISVDIRILLECVKASKTLRVFKEQNSTELNTLNICSILHRLPEQNLFSACRTHSSGFANTQIL